MSTPASLFAPPPPGTDPEQHALAIRQKCRGVIYRRIVSDLGPKFLIDPAQQELARCTALHAVYSFMPECDADWFNAADIISFSLTSLDLLKDASTVEMSPALKLRYVGQAIQASKMARQAETALQKRRKERQAMGPELIHRILSPLGAAIPVSAQYDTRPAEPPADPARDQALAEFNEHLLRQLDEIDAKLAVSASDDAKLDASASDDANPADSEDPIQPEPDETTSIPQTDAQSGARPAAENPEPSAAQPPPKPTPWQTVRNPDSEPAAANIPTEVYLRQFRRLQRDQKRAAAQANAIRRTG
jgi:hypothetical protein